MKLYKNNEDGQCFRTFRNLLEKNEKRLKGDLLDKDLNITIQPLNVDNSLEIDIGPILGQLSEGIMGFISIFFYLQTHQIKILEKYQLSDQEYQKFTREGEEDDERLLSTFSSGESYEKSSICSLARLWYSG